MAFFTVSRRQLLTSTAVGSAAGIAAPIAHTDVLGKSETATPPVALVPCMMAARTRHFDPVTLFRVGEIAERNRIREEAGLPLLSVAKELRRMKEAADIEKFRK